jgi:hypothetical protein
MGKIVIPEIFKDPNAIVTLTVESRTALKQKAIQRVDKLENFQAQYQFFDTNSGSV